MTKPEETTMRCRDCGYDLHGQPPDGQCPECGLSIRTTQHRLTFANANPVWRRRIKLGLLILIVSQTLGLVARIAQDAISRTVGTQDIDAFVAIVNGVTVPVLVVASIATAIASWFLGTPERHLGAGERRLSIRRLCRVYSAASLLMMVLSIVGFPVWSAAIQVVMRIIWAAVEVLFLCVILRLLRFSRMRPGVWLSRQLGLIAALVAIGAIGHLLMLVPLLWWYVYEPLQYISIAQTIWLVVVATWLLVGIRKDSRASV